MISKLKEQYACTALLGQSCQIFDMNTTFLNLNIAFWHG